jgi:hypothetical protein
VLVAGGYGIYPIAQRQVTDALEISMLWFYCRVAGGWRADHLRTRCSHAWQRDAGARMIAVTLIFLALLVVGVPVAFAVGSAGFVGALIASPAALATAVQQMLHQVDSFVLLSFPLFILAGALMETGGIARRLVDLAIALVGWIRGGLGMAVVVAEYVFSGISGSTVADVSAVASTTIPSMVRAGYSREQAVAIVSSASAMGILVPPCILMIVIGSIAGLSVAALFAAGFIPAVVISLALMGYIYVLAGRAGIADVAAPEAGASSAPSSAARWCPWACRPSSSAAFWAASPRRPSPRSSRCCTRRSWACSSIAKSSGRICRRSSSSPAW